MTKRERDFGIKGDNFGVLANLNLDKKNIVKSKAPIFDTENKTLEGEIVTEKPIQTETIDINKKTVLENAKPVGADVATARTIENAEDFRLDDDVHDKYAKSYRGKTKQEEARERATKFENDIAEMIAEKQKNGENVDYDEYALEYFKNLLDSELSKKEKTKIKIFHDYYVKKINNKPEKNQAEPVKIELVKPELTESEIKPVESNLKKDDPITVPSTKPEEAGQATPVITKTEQTTGLKITKQVEQKEPREGFRIIPQTEQTKGQDFKNEFEQKYPNILKTNRFREPGGKGGWVYISEYDTKTGETLCRFGEDGKNKIIAKKIKLAELDDILKKYTYKESGVKFEEEKQVEINNVKNKQEKMIANLPEKIINVFIRNASKALESFNADLSGKNGGKNFIDKYSNEDKQQLLRLLLKPVLQEFIESKRMVLAEEFGFSQDNENELLTYIFETSIK